MSNEPAELRRTLRSINALQASRIVVADLESLYKETFACANKGIPFLSALKGDEDTAIELLKKNRVPANTLNMLDITLAIGRGSDSVWKVRSMNEYLWFSRSEYFIEEAIAKDNFEFKKSNLVDKGTFDTKNLEESKVLKAYSDLNIISKKEALAEFKKRSEFLEGGVGYSLSNKEYIDSYFEVK